MELPVPGTLAGVPALLCALDRVEGHYFLLVLLGGLLGAHSGPKLRREVLLQTLLHPITI